MGKIRRNRNQSPEDAPSSDQGVQTPISLRKINCSQFYFEWSGHPIEHLRTFHAKTLQHRPDKPIVYLAGDSSLDNKYWVPGSGPSGERLRVEVPEIYHKTLDRPFPKPDVAFWLNHLLGDRATCINSSVEATTLGQRDGALLPHDKFIRDHISSEDILIVSVGANDIALRPTFSTIRHMLQLAWLTSHSSLESGTAHSLKYFETLFGTKIQDYITRLTAKTKPRAVIVCMIYFPLEAGLGQEGWADVQLNLLGYSRWPRQLQTGIHQIYEIATKQIRIDGTEVIPCALYEVLDGKNVYDYTARVEPSAEGGRKMALKFEELLRDVIVTDTSSLD